MKTLAFLSAPPGLPPMLVYWSEEDQRWIVTTKVVPDRVIRVSPELLDASEKWVG